MDPRNFRNDTSKPSVVLDLPDPFMVVLRSDGKRVRVTVAGCLTHEAAAKAIGLKMIECGEDLIRRFGPKIKKG